MAFENYKGRTIGRLLYFLYKYTFKADTFKIGNGFVYESDEVTLVATYKWDGDSDVPTFEFVDDYKCLGTIQDSIKPILTGDIHVGMFRGGQAEVSAGISSKGSL